MIRNLIALTLLGASLTMSVPMAMGELDQQSLARVVESPADARDLFKNLPVEEGPAAITALLGAVELSDMRRSAKSHRKALLVTYAWLGLRDAYGSDTVAGVLGATALLLSRQDLTVMTAALMLAAGPEGATIYASITDELAFLPDNLKDDALVAAASAAETPGIYVRPRTMEALLSISGRLLPSEPLRQPVLPVIIVEGNPHAESSGGGKAIIPTAPPPPPRPYPGQR
jgi:hypothetical protein